jgi:hypothetical protein
VSGRLLLPLVAASLVGVIGWEFAAKPALRPDVLAPIAAGTLRLRPPLHDPPSDRAIERWAGTALARPPFAPTRRPAPPALSPEQHAPDQKLPRLSGIVVAPDRLLAIFQGDQARPTAVTNGGEIAGWVVSTILQDTVLLSRDGSSLHLHPMFTQQEARAAEEVPRRLLATKRTDPHLAP